MDLSKKSIPECIKLVQDKMNEWVKLRDSINGTHFKCISCSRTLLIIKGPGTSNYHAGHCWATTISVLRFEEWNVNGQCETCNTIGEGKQDDYKVNLFNKIGEKEYQRLLTLRNQYNILGFKWDRTYLQEKYDYYSKKIKEHCGEK